MIVGVPSTSLGALDAGADRDERPRPCCTRMLAHVDGERVSTWCHLAEGHSGPHESPAPRVLPTPTYAKGVVAR